MKIFESKTCHLSTVLLIPVHGINWVPMFMSEKYKKQQKQIKKIRKDIFKSTPFVYIVVMKTWQSKRNNDEREYKT